MRLRVIVIFLLLSLISQQEAHGQMRQLSESSIADNHVKNISFYSPAQGFVAFTKWLGFTTDSGRTFTQRPITIGNVDYNGYTVNLTFGFGIRGVKAFNQDTVIAYGDYGTVPAILYSVNGGATFKLVFHSQYSSSLNGGVVDMVFPQNGSVGLAVDRDRVLKSTNKGLSWTFSYINAGFGFGFIEAADAFNIIAGSASDSYPRLIKTSTAGNTWSEKSLPSEMFTWSSKSLLYSHFLAGGNKGWINLSDFGSNSVIYYTTDGANTWLKMNDNGATPFACTKMKFINDSTGFAITNLYATFKTTDSGKIWQQVPRNNNYAYLGYGHNDILINGTQLWAGGGHGFLEMNTNLDGTLFPKAAFKIDTVNLAATNKVNLKSFSKRYYQHTWNKNGVFLSNALNPFYVHDPNKLKDTIQLIVSNGFANDTSVHYVEFYPSVTVTSFSPSSAVTGTVITINGTNFNGLTSVRFGGFNASAINYISNSQINATVGAGGSGTIIVYTATGAGSIAGFTFIVPPNANLPVTVSKNSLCKKESTTVTIQNTELNVKYDFIDSLNNVYGTGLGNGSTISFNASSIAWTGNYYLKASLTNYNSSVISTNKTFIFSENTKAAFIASKVNVQICENFNLVQQSQDALSFAWYFGVGANVTSSAIPNPTGISFSSSGPKTITLIATSVNGCKDTLARNEVYVYQKSTPDNTCYNFTLDSSDTKPQSLNSLSIDKQNNYYVCGQISDTNQVVNSRYGFCKKFQKADVAYLANYTADGVLRWTCYLKNIGRDGYGLTPNSAGIIHSTPDDKGNVYVTGYLLSTDYFYLKNGTDSFRIYAQGSDTIPFSSKQIGFILKLDSLGNKIWYTVLYNTQAVWQGYDVSAGSPRKLVFKNNHIILMGGFTYNLAYARNGQIKQLYSFPPSVYPQDYQDTYILKIKEDGSLVWKTYSSFSSVNYYQLSDIAADSFGNIYSLGTYEQSYRAFDADSTSQIYLTGNTAYNRAFIMKYDSTGHVKWYNYFKTGYQYGVIDMLALAVDSLGNSYASGKANTYTTNTVIVTDKNGASSSFSMTGLVFFKFDANGNVKWSNGTSNSSAAASSGDGSAICLKGNNIYLVGKFANNNQPFTLSSTNGASVTNTLFVNEFFVANYDTLGVLKNFTRSGTNINGSVNVSSIYLDAADNFLMGGNAQTYNSNPNPTVFGMPAGIFYPGDGIIIKTNTNFCSNVVPLELLDFTAVLNKEKKEVFLNWQTVNEVNTEKFILEKSTDVVHWSTISSLQAMNTTAKHDYTYTDKDPFIGKGFYRIKMFDKDGSYKYSPIRTVQWLDAKSTNLFTIAPNPVKDVINFYFNSSLSSVNFTLMDMHGKTVLKQTINNANGKVKMPLGYLSTGQYTVIIETKTTVQVEKIIVAQ